MEQLNPLFSEAYFVSSFIGSMRNDIAAAMRMFKPATMFEPHEPVTIRPKFFHHSPTLLTRLDPRYPLSTITSPSYLPNPSLLITQDTTLILIHQLSVSLSRPYLLFHPPLKTFPPSNETPILVSSAAIPIFLGTVVLPNN